MVYPVRTFPNENTIHDVGQVTVAGGEFNRENARKCSVAAKDSEAQWQDVSWEKEILTNSLAISSNY